MMIMLKTIDSVIIVTHWRKVVAKRSFIEMFMLE